MKASPSEEIIVRKTVTIPEHLWDFAVGEARRTQCGNFSAYVRAVLEKEANGHKRKGAGIRAN